ncbi:MAG: hypothetical protein LBT88_07030, partial [Oscillospiraceae bacterium]|nr:hypothetical protein [Oscillospiraceae bacterium]
MTYEQPQYNELLNMLASPAVIVRDGTVISANGLAKDKYCKADGAPVIVQISDSEAEIDGELYGFASTLTDGTELYLSKDTVFIDRMKEFMTNINSPLREVVGTSLASLRLIEQKLSVIDHSVKREVSMFMNMLRKSQFRLIRAVENITEAMEQDKERENIKHIDFYAIDIRNLMVSLITSIKALFKENELNIEYRDDFSDDVIIAGNPIRIESMIVNLLSNAILHSSPVGSP